MGGGGVYYVNPHLRTPYIYQYNLSVQREIMHDTTLEVSYIGSDSHKLTALKDGNPFILGTNTRLFNTQPGVPSNGFSYLPEFNNVVQAYYNSLAIGLHKRYSETKFGVPSSISSPIPTATPSTTLPVSDPPTLRFRPTTRTGSGRLGLRPAPLRRVQRRLGVAVRQDVG